ncbi:MAG: alpha-amylase [candidate division NC10 bacterium RBG_16_65_8]|nr:MAG: alpha-amylase [candidate division NC10 bacterium RBG_16_65_8]
MTWPKQPVIYEINAWVWLYELSQRLGRPVTLASVPAEAWDALGGVHADAVWLMGVWERSPVGVRVASAHEGLQMDFRRALPDFTPEDNVGSPYCVRRYVVDPHLGGPEGLAVARRDLAARGLRLLLDFVPNHVAPDHPWVAVHANYFIRGTGEDLSRTPDEYYETGRKIFACGRDPYFPPWRDVLQLNAFHPGLRRAAIQTLHEIAGQCDGVRCDMAMLLITRVFEQTWGARAGSAPANEYWRDVIRAVRAAHPDFLFMAEAYWDLEWELMRQGFDYCYDKRLYDRLEHDFAEQIRLHLLADPGYQDRLVRFIENHDEPRAAATFPGGKGRAAAVTFLTLRGAKLLHEGQLEGRRVRLPVQLRRRPPEPVDEDLRAFYRRLLAVIDTPAMREGEWRLCQRSGWPDNQSCMNLVAWCWRAGDDRRLIVVNLSDARSHARVSLPWDDLAGRRWRLADALSGSVYERSGDDLRSTGLYVDLEGWAFHLLRFGKSV